MTGWQDVKLTAALAFAFMAALWVLTFQAANHRHCRYLVPVNEHPHVYQCAAKP